MTLLEKEPVKRAEKSIKEYNSEMSIIVLDSSAKTAIEAASSLGCEVGAIVKSLLFKTDNTFTLFLVSGDVNRNELNSGIYISKITDENGNSFVRNIIFK